MFLFFLFRPRMTGLFVAALLIAVSSVAYAGNVVGYVKNRSGVGISGATVTIAGATTQCDSTGKYTLLAIPVGPQTVTAGAGYYSANSVRVTVPSTGTVAASTIVLSSYLGEIRGYITDAATQSPIMGASVSVVGGSASTTTSSAGIYHLPGVWNGSQTVSVTAAGYQPTSGVISVLGDSSVTLNIGMKRGLPSVVITGVRSNNDSVKVTFNPVPGAKDYRIYVVSDPATVKYAGIWHLDADYMQTFLLDSSGAPLMPVQETSNGAVSGPTHIDIPATEIEWNGLQPGQSTRLIVEAVDAVGPFPAGNVATALNTPTCSCQTGPGCSCQGGSTCTCQTGGCCQTGTGCSCGMLGSNSGMTKDGKTSTNGQGDPGALPNVIARSASFAVQATGIPALPSGSDASQVFFDPFSSGQITPVGAVDPVNGLMQFTMTTAAGNWDILTSKVDTNNTMPMLSRAHFMDVLFDGGTPNTNNPLHQSHASLAFSPQKTFDFSNGQILHVTMEIDSHTDNRRWAGIDLAPADDPLFDWYSTEAQINNSDQAIMNHIYKDHPTLDAFYGPFSSTWNLPNGDPVMGAAGQAFNTPMRPTQGFQYGRGLDDRSRFDLFISQMHFIWFEDGITVCEADIPRGVPFSNAKVYFTHYVYHTDNEVDELLAGASYETFWLNEVPHSDERHWDNVGIEVLPALTPWSSLWNRVQLPALTAPVY